jgi:hypothetical protein
MKEIDADGINGDTQDGVPLAFSLAADKVGHPLAFEPEGGPSDEALAWNVMGWGQYGGQFDFVPGVEWRTVTNQYCPESTRNRNITQPRPRGLTNNPPRTRVQETHGIGGRDRSAPNHDGGSDYVTFTKPKPTG